MRILLAMSIVVGLILNSGGAYAFVLHGQAAASGSGHGRAHAMAHSHRKNAQTKQAEGCHEAPSKSQPAGCKCCAKKAKCAHESCLCLKCFSALADVRPMSYAGVRLATLHEPGLFDKPPGGVRQPPPPPPQA